MIRYLFAWFSFFTNQTSDSFSFNINLPALAHADIVSQHPPQIVTPLYSPVNSQRYTSAYGEVRQWPYAGVHERTEIPISSSIVMHFSRALPNGFRRLRATCCIKFVSLSVQIR